jgi:hypothetical protein
VRRRQLQPAARWTYDALVVPGRPMHAPRCGGRVMWHVRLEHVKNSYVNYNGRDVSSTKRLAHASHVDIEGV